MTMDTAGSNTTPGEDGASAFWRGFGAVGGAALGMATGFGCLILPSVVIVPIGLEFGWSRSELSVCYTLAAFGMALGGLLWGRLADRIDNRWLLWIGGFFLVAPLLAMSRADKLWQFYLASTMLGLAGFGCLYAPLVSAASDWFESRRGLVMGIVTAGGALGQGLMPFAAERLIAAAGWRNAFVAIAAVLMVLQYIVAMLVRRRAAAVIRRPASSWWDGAMTQPRVMILALAAFMCCACMGVPLVHLAGFVSAVCGSSSLGATSLLIAMVSGAVGRIFFGMLADRIGGIPSYAVASLLQTVCVLGFPALQSELPILALSAVFGFGFAGNMTCLILCVRNEVPASRFGGAIGAVMFIAWIGMGVGGYLGGALFDLTGAFDLAFQAAAVFGAANMLALTALAISGRRPLTLSPR